MKTEFKTLFTFVSENNIVSVEKVHETGYIVTQRQGEKDLNPLVFGTTNAANALSFAQTLVSDEEVEFIYG